MSCTISQRDEPMYQIASSRGSQLKGVDCSSWRLHSSGMIQTEMNARCHPRISLSYGEVQQDGDEYHEAGVRFYPTDECCYSTQPRLRRNHNRGSSRPSRNQVLAHAKHHMRSASWVRILSSLKSADHREIELCSHHSA